MRTKLICLNSMALCISLTAHASERLLVQVPAVLDPAAPIVDSVKRECGVELLIGNHVFQKVNERIGGAKQLTDVAKAGPDKLLQLTILSVQGVGGGNWSGYKAITIRAQVSQNSQVIGTTVLRRKSSGGMLGGVSGTCAIMERVAIALGQDVAGWLATGMPASRRPAANRRSDAQAATEENNDVVVDEPKQ